MIIEMVCGSVAALCIIIAGWTVMGRSEDLEEFKLTLKREMEYRDRNIRELNTELEVLKKSDNSIIDSLKQRNEELEKKNKAYCTEKLLQASPKKEEVKEPPFVIEMEPFGPGTEQKQVVPERRMSKHEKKLLRR